MAAARTRRYPALAGSAALHAALIAAALISWPWGKTLHMGDVVPVTIMTSTETPAPAPASQSSTPTEAATPQPTPNATAQTAAPVEQPTPTPPHPKAQPAPKAEVTPPQPKAQPTPTPKVAPTPAKQPPRPAAPSEDWASLERTLQQQSQTAAGPRQSQAQRGPPRLSQAVQPRNTEGVAATLSSGPANPRAQAALGSLSGEIGRLWSPNCGVPMGDLLIKVTFKIGANGMLQGDPTSSDANAGDLPTRVASERAVRAVRMREPFADPAYAALYGQNVTVSFSQKQHCSNK